MKNLVRDIFPAWLGCILLPLPAIILWHSDDGVPWRFGLFFIGCASLVANAFRGDLRPDISAVAERPEKLWRRRLAVVTVALLVAWALFCSLCFALNDPHDFALVWVAFSILIPPVCLVPFLTLLTRKPVAAVVFSVFLVTCMKFLGCVVVVLVYGWDASERGHTAMPWARPNLLVWLFWLNTSVLCLSFYCLGARRFCNIYARAV